MHSCAFGLGLGNLLRTKLGIRQFAVVASLLALPVGLVLYFIMFQRGWFYGPMPGDFAHLWIAGELWESGQSPYGPEFLARISKIAAPAPYVYPPNWYLLSRTLAVFDPATANWLWCGVSTALIGLASWLCIQSLLKFEPHFAPWARSLFPTSPISIMGVTLPRWAPSTCLLAGFIFAAKAAGTNVHLGQTGVFAWIGLACVIYGVVFDKRAWVAAGLVALLMKPQIGLPFAVTMLLTQKTRMPALIAIGVTGLMASLALLADSPTTLMRGFLDNVAAYSSSGRLENAPDAMTGIGNYLVRGGLTISTFAWVGLAAVAGLVGGLLVKRRLGDQADTALIMAITTACAVALMVPLHDWDLLFVGVFAAAFVFLRGPALALGVIGLLPFTRLAILLETLVPGETWLDDQRVSATAFAIGIPLCCLGLALELMRRTSRTDRVKMTPGLS